MSDNTEHSETADILVVDDTPANLQLLAGLLKKRGHKVRPVPSGKLALQAARRQPPDLILLDINMPEMDGYAVCAELKADPRLAEIPVIFISANTEVLDKVKAFSAGGVDYVTKPFQFEEVEARVCTHLELCRQKRLLKENLESLSKLAILRDNLTHMIVHDMRSPLMAVACCLDLLRPLLEGKDEDTVRFWKLGQVSAKELTDMCNALLDVSRLEAGQMPVTCEPCDLLAMAGEAAADIAPLADFRKILIQVQGAPVSVTADKGLLHRVLVNLINNAVKYAPGGSEVVVSVTGSGEAVRVEVTDTGRGIAPEDHQKIFEKFGQVAGDQGGAKHSCGLGLTFCKLAVEAHSGQIGVNSEVGKGSTFWFTLPLR